jgi:hypothetical protein
MRLYQLKPIEQIERPEAERVWKEYPISDYGKKWDAPGS